MEPNAKKSLNKLLNKEDEPTAPGGKDTPIKIKTESPKSGNAKTEPAKPGNSKTTPPEKEKSKIEQFINNARLKKEMPKKEMVSEALTPYQEQRKRQRQVEQEEKAKLQKKKVKVEEKADDTGPKQHLPQEAIIETTMTRNSLSFLSFSFCLPFPFF
jgi:hypothetical protein